MAGIFRLLQTDARDAGEGPAYRIGLDIHVGVRAMDCPVTGPCRSAADMRREIEALKADLGRILRETEGLLEREVPGGGPDVSPDMTAGEIWSVLSGMSDDGAFTAAFNALGLHRRREVAEHVLTRCNVFSGRAAVFSARFDSETAFIG